MIIIIVMAGLVVMRERDTGDSPPSSTLICRNWWWSKIRLNRNALLALSSLAMFCNKDASCVSNDVSCLSRPADPLTLPLNMPPMIPPPPASFLGEKFLRGGDGGEFMSPSVSYTLMVLPLLDSKPSPSPSRSRLHSATELF